MNSESNLATRLAADIEGSFVIFLIGAQVRRWWKIHKWWPVATAMTRMMKELEQDPSSGFLGVEVFGGTRSLMVQYWKSRDHLYAYAHDSNKEHRLAWRDFNRRIGDDGDVGIWHETYEVQAGASHSLYRGMPPFGAGKAFGTKPASKQRMALRAA